MVINALNLYSEFDMEAEVFIPLLLQDKTNVLETLVRDSPEQQVLLVQMFDRFSNRRFDLNSLLKTTRVRSMELSN